MLVEAGQIRFFPFCRTGCPERADATSCRSLSQTRTLDGHPATVTWDGPQLPPNPSRFGTVQQRTRLGVRTALQFDSHPEEERGDPKMGHQPNLNTFLYKNNVWWQNPTLCYDLGRPKTGPAMPQARKGPRLLPAAAAPKPEPT